MCYLFTFVYLNNTVKTKYTHIIQVYNDKIIVKTDVIHKERILLKKSNKEIF